MSQEYHKALQELADKIKVVSKDLGKLGDSLRGAAGATLPLMKGLTDELSKAIRESIKRYDAMTEEERTKLDPAIRQAFESFRKATHGGKGDKGSSV